MATSKLSVSVKENWLNFINDYKTTHEIKSTSEVIEKGLAALKQLELQEQYRQAYEEWESSGEQALWDVTVGDGIT